MEDTMEEGANHYPAGRDNTALRNNWVGPLWALGQRALGSDCHCLLHLSLGHCRAYTLHATRTHHTMTRAQSHE
eukprot:3209579-Amphidinium_carterae.3